MAENLGQKESDMLNCFKLSENQSESWLFSKPYRCSDDCVLTFIGRLAFGQPVDQLISQIWLGTRSDGHMVVRSGCWPDGPWIGQSDDR